MQMRKTNREKVYYFLFFKALCGSDCLNVEKMAPFVNVFEISFSFGIDFDIVETIVKCRLSRYYMPAVLFIASD